MTFAAISTLSGSGGSGGGGSGGGGSSFDWFFLTETIWELECSLRRSCPDYQSSFLGQLMALGTSLPTFTYIIAAFLAFYDRTVTNVLLTWGMLINGLVLFLVDLAFDRMLLPMDTGCGHTRRLRPAARAGIVWFVWFFQQFYHAFTHGCCSRKGCVSLSFGRFQILVFALYASAAQIYLSVYHPYEVVAAVAVALVSACATSIFLHWVVIPLLSRDWFKTACGWFGVSTAHPLHVIRDGFALVPVQDPDELRRATEARQAEAYRAMFTPDGIAREAQLARGAAGTRVLSRFDSDAEGSN